MARNQYLNSTQKGIVNRYYANQDARVVGRLQELVSDLYLTAPGAGLDRKWETVARELAKTNADAAAVQKIVGARDVKALALLVAKPGFSAQTQAKPKVEKEEEE